MASFTPAKHFIQLGDEHEYVDTFYVRDSTGTWQELDHFEFFRVKKIGQHIFTASKKRTIGMEMNFHGYLGYKVFVLNHILIIFNCLL